MLPRSYLRTSCIFPRIRLNKSQGKNIMIIPYKNGACRVSSPFGQRTLNGVSGWHNGIDLVGLDGDRTLVAPCDGVVRSSTMIPKSSGNITWEWGNYIRIDTVDGYNIFMCHMAERKVVVGQQVKAGDIVGIQGNTGYSFGEHCHFEVRKNGLTINPAALIGILNAVGTYHNPVKQYSDKYTKNGLTFRKLNSFRIVYHDAMKIGANYQNYINAGFFGNYKSANGTIYTLPVANLVCDPWNVPEEGRKDIQQVTINGKIRVGSGNGWSTQFKGKEVSTLVVPKLGNPYIADMLYPPDGCLYAISGVPTVRNGDDVNYYNYVVKQGWDASCMRATWRNWLGIRDGQIWLIMGQTTTSNYIYGMEFWKKVKDEKFDDIICLDGGGSFMCKMDGKITRTSENRRINNLVVFT